MTLPFDPPPRGGAGADTDTATMLASDWVRHSGDLAAITQIGGSRWTDALLSELRSHIAGCLNMVEMAVRVELAGSWVERALDMLGDGLCRSALDRAPVLLSPTLVEHFRLRAAAALVLRMRSLEPELPPESSIAPSDDRSPPSHDPALEGALTALSVAIDPWHDAHAANLPMRADLPAEIYSELAWSVAALLLDTLDAHGVESAAATAPLVRAVEAVVARHDEQNGPFARAVMAAGLVADGTISARLAERAVDERNLLLLGALAARAAQMSMTAALAILIDGAEDERVALAVLLGLNEEAFAALMTALAPLRDDMDDGLLGSRMAAFRSMTSGAAAALLTRWQGPEALVSRRLLVERARR